MSTAYAFGTEYGDSFSMPPWIVKNKETAILAAQNLNIIFRPCSLRFEDTLNVEVCNAPDGVVGMLFEQEEMFVVICFCSKEKSESLISELRKNIQVCAVNVGTSDGDSDSEEEQTLDCPDHGEVPAMKLRVGDVVWKMEN